SERFCDPVLAKADCAATGGSGCTDVGCGDRLSPSQPRITSARAATRTNFGFSILGIGLGKPSFVPRELLTRLRGEPQRGSKFNSKPSRRFIVFQRRRADRLEMSMVKLPRR